MNLKQLMHNYQQRFEEKIASHLPAAEIQPQYLHQAMRYAVLDGGKRVRPLLTYFSGQALGVNDDILDIPAMAMELIHVYSLVHDDLPAMDDDDLRRGKPTVHKAYDEATAILVGDALQTQAFELLAHAPMPDVAAETRLKMMEVLARASGSRGMCGGQAIDIAAEGKELSLAELENMHIHKTGALLRASVKLGALCSAGLTDAQLQQLDHFGKCIGLAFQIQDDILDITASTEELGKQQGADAARSKPTYPTLLGLEGARERAQDLYQQALESLDSFGEPAQPLRDLAQFIVQRGN